MTVNRWGSSFRWKHRGDGANAVRLPAKLNPIKQAQLTKLSEILYAAIPKGRGIIRKADCARLSLYQQWLADGSSFAVYDY